MNQAEFVAQIAKHKANRKKYAAILGIVGYAKLLALLLMAVLLYLLLTSRFRTDLIIINLMGVMAFSALLLYQEKVRDRIAHSSNMIKINRTHQEALSGMLEIVPGAETDLIHYDLTGVVLNYPAWIDMAPGLSEHMDREEPSRPPEPGDDQMFAKKGAARFLTM